MNKKRKSLSLILELTGKKKAFYFWSIFFAVINVAGKVFPFFVVGDIVQRIINGEKDFKVYFFRVLVIALLYLCSEAAHSLSTAFSHSATFSLLGGLRKAALDKLNRVPLGYVKSQPSGNFKSIIVEKIDSLETTFAHIVPEFTSNLLAPIAIFIYFSVIDWRLVLWSLVPVGIGLILLMIVMASSGKYYPRVLKSMDDLNGAAIEYIDGIEVVKAFCKAESSYEKFRNAAIENANSFIDWMRHCIFTQTSSLVITPMTLLSVLPMGAFYVSNGSLSVADYVMCLILSFCLVRPVIIMFSYIDDYRRAQELMKQVKNILDEDELVRPEKSENEASEKIFSDNSIELKDVRFSYSYENSVEKLSRNLNTKANEKSGGKEVLHGINMKIGGGTFAALVGPSGSGKSTIAKLIASFWDSADGEIRIGGTDIRKIPLSEYNEKIAYVSQDNFLFNLSVRENIRIGKPSATDLEVEEIAKKSGCYDFIMNLENGFETLCGSSFSHLSGGEKQRISIARAMLKDAPVVILDEATSYTDPENEAVIQSSIAKLVEGKTLLVIAHRLSTVKDADKIFVVNSGNIEAEGKHDELLEKCPLYKEMWNAHILAKDSSDSEADSGSADSSDDSSSSDNLLSAEKSDSAEK